MSKHRYVEGGRGSVDIAVDNAAAYEDLAKMYERHAREARYYGQLAESAKCLKEAERYRKLAEAEIARGLRDEAEIATDPVEATGFTVRPGWRVRPGKAVPTYLKGKGGSAIPRRQLRHKR